MGEEKNKNIEEIHKLLVKKEIENITLEEEVSLMRKGSKNH